MTTPWQVSMLFIIVQLILAGWDLRLFGCGEKKKQKSTPTGMFGRLQIDLGWCMVWFWPCALRCRVPVCCWHCAGARIQWGEFVASSLMLLACVFQSKSHDLVVESWHNSLGRNYWVGLPHFIVLATSRLPSCQACLYGSWSPGWLCSVARGSLPCWLCFERH